MISLSKAGRVPNIKNISRSLIDINNIPLNHILLKAPKWKSTCAPTLMKRKPKNPPSTSWGSRLRGQKIKKRKTPMIPPPLTPAELSVRHTSDFS
jgi:hypothetical protein